MSIVSKNFREMESSMDKAREEKDYLASVYDRVFEPYMRFDRVVEDSGSVGTVDVVSFKDDILGVMGGGLPSLSDLLAGDKGLFHVDAGRYLSSMLVNCLVDGKDFLHDADLVMDALGSSCSFDGKWYALFRNDYSTLVLDKGSGRLSQWSNRNELVDEVSAPAGRGKPNTFDPVFNMYFEKYHGFFSFAWRKHAFPDMDNRLHWNAASAHEVSPLRYSGESKLYRESLLRVLRHAEPFAVDSGKGRRIDFETVEFPDVDGLLFVPQERGSSDIRVSFKDGSSLSASHLSTFNLKLVKQGLDRLLSSLKKQDKGVTM